MAGGRADWLAGGRSSGERSVRVTVAYDDHDAVTGVGEHTSNGRPLLRRDNTLPTLVRVRRRLVRVVERLQLYNVLLLAIVVVTVTVDAAAAAHVTVVDRTGSVVPRRTGMVHVVPVSRARARAHGRVVGR